MLSDIFGYDKYNEVTSEYAIRGTFCDIAIQIDSEVKFLIEVKAVGQELKETHINQAVAYGAKEGIEWIILTTGHNWKIFRLSTKMQSNIRYYLNLIFQKLILEKKKIPKNFF